MIRWLLLFTLLAPSAWASCTNAEAYAKQVALSETLKAKMATKPDQAGDLMGEMGDAISAGVTEALCRKLDELTAKARRL